MEELSKKPETKTEDKTINKKSLKFSNIEIVKLLPIFDNVRHKKIILSNFLLSNPDLLEELIFQGFYL